MKKTCRTYLNLSQKYKINNNQGYLNSASNGNPAWAWGHLTWKNFMQILQIDTYMIYMGFPKKVFHLPLSHNIWSHIIWARLI